MHVDEDKVNCLPLRLGAILYPMPPPSGEPCLVRQVPGRGWLHRGLLRQTPQQLPAQTTARIRLPYMQVTHALTHSPTHSLTHPPTHSLVL